MQISNTAPNDKLISWFRKQSPERQASLEEKAITFCRANRKSLIAGYERNKGLGGDAFERNREMLVKSFIEHRTRRSFRGEV